MINVIDRVLCYQELMADFDNELRLREHEFNLRMDEMRTVVLAHELKVRSVCVCLCVGVCKDSQLKLVW